MDAVEEWAPSMELHLSKEKVLYRYRCDVRGPTGDEQAFGARDGKYCGWSRNALRRVAPHEHQNTRPAHIFNASQLHNHGIYR
jgi:hypothetical protein